MSGTRGARESVHAGLPAGRAERVVVIRGEAPLVGCLHEAMPGDGPGLLMLNAGLIPKTGPDRLYVALARQIAARGIPVLRVDGSGVGDSPPRLDHLPFAEARLREARSAIDWFTGQGGVARVVLLGLCTGADHAYETARVDERVAGLILLDGYPHRTAGWWIRHYGPRLFRLRSWKTLIRRGLDAGPPGAPSEGAAGWDGIARDIPSRAELGRSLTRLVDRGVDSLWIYTGGFREWYNHRGQFRAALRGVSFRGRVEVEYLPEADHVFRAPEARRRLLDLVGDWLGRRFSAGPAPDGPTAARGT